MDKIPLADFFERTGFNNVKELDCPIFPRVFDLCLTGLDFTGHLLSKEESKNTLNLWPFL